MSARVNGTLLWGLAVYLPRQRRKKKAMHAMLAVARAPGVGEVAAMSMVVHSIFSGIGWTQFGAGSTTWKLQRRHSRQKSVAPRAVSRGSRVPSRASIWPTKWRTFSTVQDWTSQPQGAMLLV